MSRLRSTLVAAAAAMLAGSAAAEAQNAALTIVYIGTHTSGPGQGLFSARLDPATGRLSDLKLAAEIERPTWQEVDPHRPILYSVSETGNDGKSQGGVYSLKIDPATGALAVIDRVDSGGGGATYLSYDPVPPTVFVANFGGGNVAALPVSGDGALASATSVGKDYGTGPTKRQASPHAHAAVVDPSGRFVLVPDLGADRVFVYRFDGAARRLVPAATPFVALPPGSGPRHLAFSPDGRFAFLDTELTAMIYSFGWDAHTGVLTPLGNVAVDPAGSPPPHSAAEIAVSQDGRFLYVSSRSGDALVVYSIDRRTGGLSEQQRLPSGGKTPWSFGIDPTGRWMVVADEGSNQLAVFKINPTTGSLTPTDKTLTVPSPVSLAFYR